MAESTSTHAVVTISGLNRYSIRRRKWFSNPLGRADGLRPESSGRAGKYLTKEGKQIADEPEMVANDRQAIPVDRGHVTDSLRHGPEGCYCVCEMVPQHRPA